MNKTGRMTEMQETTLDLAESQQSPATLDCQDLDALRHVIEYAAHLLPAQGPITVFVHHNTLHAFEDLSFDEGVKAGGKLFGCHAYLPEERYRQKLERGRIRVEDLVAVLLGRSRGRSRTDHRNIWVTICSATGNASVPI